jgi:hypothetical protein
MLAAPYRSTFLAALRLLQGRGAALFSLPCFLCLVFFALFSLPCFLCLVFFASFSLPCLLLEGRVYLDSVAPALRGIKTN